MKPISVIGSASPGGLALGSALPSPCSFYGPRGLFFDGDNLIVADTGNHRVLIFNSFDPSKHNEATVVLGQPDFFSEMPANGGPEKGLFMPTGVLVHKGSLIVADGWHHRVLVWSGLPESNWQEPTYVIGQDKLSEIEPNRGTECNPHGLYWPFGIGFAANKFWIADTGNRRVLGWNDLPLDGEAPQVIIGQDDGYSHEENRGGVGRNGFRWVHDITGDETSLYLSDAGNHRVLYWPTCDSNDSEARAIIGQPDAFSTSEWPYGPHDQKRLRFPYSASLFQGRMAIADTANNRVLLYRDAPTTTFPSADDVIGQDNFAENGENRWKEITDDSMCWPYAVQLLDDLLFVADTGNNRVVVWRVD